MHDVIYEAESALCNINKHHLQLYLHRFFIVYLRPDNINNPLTSDS